MEIELGAQLAEELLWRPVDIQFKMCGNTVVYSTHTFFWSVALTHQEPHQTSGLIIPRVTVGLGGFKGLFQPRINSMILWFYAWGSGRWLATWPSYMIWTWVLVQALDQDGAHRSLLTSSFLLESHNDSARSLLSFKQWKRDTPKQRRWLWEDRGKAMPKFVFSRVTLDHHTEGVT